MFFALDPDPYIEYTDPQHCFKARRIRIQEPTNSEPRIVPPFSPVLLCVVPCQTYYFQRRSASNVQELHNSYSLPLFGIDNRAGTGTYLVVRLVGDLLAVLAFKGPTGVHVPGNAVDPELIASF